MPLFAIDGTTKPAGYKGCLRHLEKQTCSLLLGCPMRVWRVYGQQHDEAPNIFPIYANNVADALASLYQDDKKVNALNIP